MRGRRKSLKTSANAWQNILFPLRIALVRECKRWLKTLLPSTKVRIAIGRPVGCVLRGQPSDRVRLARQDHQAVEHARRVQVHHPGGRSLRLGVLRALLAKPLQPDHRVRRLGSHRQGLELGQLQAEDRPSWSQRLPQLGVRFARRFPVHVRR
uniref:(northern house mosquito) hypothetical protein n=1 Tax=Culex pipiens TaxID=7175 RepID=A0A8D8ESZ2_CULPI